MLSDNKVHNLFRWEGRKLLAWLEREPEIKVGSEEQVAEEIILLLILTLVFIDFNLNKLLFEIHRVTHL